MDAMSEASPPRGRASEGEEEHRVSPTIIFDFDGTLALGNGPIVAYANAVAEETGNAEFLGNAMSALDEFEAGRTTRRDGYDVVGTLATDAGVRADVLNRAYLASRAALADPGSVAAPEGLLAFLTRLGSHARLVLATNAPGDGIISLLESWGVAEAFDELHFSVGKPGGLEPILDDALTRGPVLSVGDIVAFDLAPALARGAATALVGATAERAPESVTFRGASLHDLYSDIETWAATAASASPTSPAPHPVERHS